MANNRAAEPGVLRVRTGFKARPHQRDLHRSLRRFNVLVAHRRFGKTVYAVNELIEAAAACTLPKGRYGYVAPFLTQAKDIAWSYLKDYTAAIPGVKANESELWVELPNGARIRLYGADNADRLRGGYFDGVVLDENAQMAPRVWAEIIRPMLSDRLGWAIFIGTPMGRNAFYRLYDQSQNGFLQPDGSRFKDESWTGFLLKASETGIIPSAELAASRVSMSPDQYAQEFEVSFDAAVPGAYYAKLLTEIEHLGRIRPIPYEPSLPVHTAWDLGFGDATSIWFAQVHGGEPRIIDYLEASGVGLDWYAQQLRAEHRSNWTYGVHFLPHDAAVHDLGSGMSRIDTLKGFGIVPTVLERSSIDDGINQARFLIRRAWFNTDRCGAGLEALRLYRSEWDERRQALKPTPLHDWTSNAADAFRYMAIGLAKHLIGRQILADPSLSAATRVANQRRVAAGTQKMPYGWGNRR